MRDSNTKDAQQRRQLLGAAGLWCAGLGLGAGPATAHAQKQRVTQGAAGADRVSRRPPKARRRFTSAAVEATIADVATRLKDAELAWLFANCFPNTLDTTVTVGSQRGKPDTYVITGDIDAMWLRDSAAQVWPYLPLMKQDPALERLVAGVVNRHARYVRIDPYANAFYKDASRVSHWKDRTLMRPGVHERKWEVDSLCYVIRLAHGFWRAGGDTSLCFDANWLAAMRVIVATFIEQQRKTGPGPYSFRRKTDWATDAAGGGDGTGNLIKPTGMICSVFRPSDDGTIFPFLVPSNCMAVQSLRQLADMVAAFYSEPAFEQQCRALANEVAAALRAHAVVLQPGFGRMLAYEVDGFGSRYMADDANVPSLLSLPYLGALEAFEGEGQALYDVTRRFVLTEGANPFFTRGAAAEGQASPHTGPEKIWPMGIILRGMTSSDDAEIMRCLQWLKTTHAGTGFMHESFDRDDPTKFTRKWFAWANTLFGEFVLQLLAQRPALLV